MVHTKRNIVLKPEYKTILDEWMNDCRFDPYQGLSDEEKQETPFVLVFDEKKYGVNRFKLHPLFLKRLVQMNNNLILMDLIYNIRFGISPDMKQLVLGSRLHDMIVFHPDFLYNYTPDEQALVILHQLTHFLYGHEYRSKGLKYPILWNALCDWVSVQAAQTLFAKKEQKGIKGIKGEWFRLELASVLSNGMSGNEKSSPYLMSVIKTILTDYEDVSANMVYDEILKKPNAEEIIEKIQYEYMKTQICCDLHVAADQMFNPTENDHSNTQLQETMEAFVNQSGFQGFHGTQQELQNQITEFLNNNGLDQELAEEQSNALMQELNNHVQQHDYDDNGAGKLSNDTDNMPVHETENHIPNENQSIEPDNNNNSDSLVDKAKKMLSDLFNKKTETQKSAMDAKGSNEQESAINSGVDSKGSDAQKSAMGSDGDSKDSNGQESAINSGMDSKGSKGQESAMGSSCGQSQNNNMSMSSEQNGANQSSGLNELTMELGSSIVTRHADNRLSIKKNTPKDLDHNATFSRLGTDSGAKSFHPQNDPNQLDSGSASDEIAKLMNLPEKNENIKKKRDLESALHMFKKMSENGTLAGTGVEADSQFAYLDQDDGVVDWQTALSRYMREAHNRRHAGLDYSRQNRKASAIHKIQRQMGMGNNKMLIPASKKIPQISTVWVALDVSGSMEDEQLNDAVNEIYSILKNLRPKKVVINSFNAGLVEDIILTDLDDLKDFKIQRGGGTEIEPLYKRFEEMERAKDKDYPEFLIVLTDMFLTTPPQPKNMDVYWINLSEHSSDLNKEFPTDAGVLIDTKRPDQAKKIVDKLKKKR